MKPSSLILCALFSISIPLFAGAPAVNAASTYGKSYKAEAAGDYAGAIAAMGDLFSAFPNGYTVNARLGWLHYLKGSFAESIKHYESARKAVPTSVEAHLGLANVALVQGKYGEAETVLKNALILDPLHYTANLKLSYASRMLKKPQEAQKIAVKLLALFPADVTLMVEYGWARWAQGDLTTATAIFTDVLTLDPGNLEAKAYFAPAR